jgi:hypothetical protein
MVPAATRGFAGIVGTVGVVRVGVVTGGVDEAGVEETGVEEAGVDEEGVVVVLLLPVQPAKATEATARTMRSVGSFMTRTRARAITAPGIIVSASKNDR